MTAIYILSGFLGAGKTTLIQKLLRNAFCGQKVVLIENDFGEQSVDAALLRETGFAVRELSAGCICCTLVGDFVKALQEILVAYHPDIVLIEPSGVGKLSDVTAACAHPAISKLARVVRKITVVDATRCERYWENFGEFFEDQMKNADVIYLNRAQEAPKKTKAALNIAKTLVPHAVLFTHPLEQLPVQKLLEAAGAEEQRSEPPCGHDHHEHGGTCEAHCHEHGGACEAHGHEHGGACEAHCHEHGGACETHCHAAGEQQTALPAHSHAADEAFETLSIPFQHEVDKTEIAAKLNALQDGRYGRVLRAKGILQGASGPFCIQYLPGECKITRSAAAGNALYLIGEKLHRDGIMKLFEEEH